VRQHNLGAGHPEQPARHEAVISALQSKPLIPIAVAAATDDQLARAHTRPYIELVRREVAEGRRELSTGDTDITKHSLDAATLAAGCCLGAVDAVFRKEATNAFCAVRPPGHHASANVGMGFCLFNNIAIAARHAQVAHNAERVLIVDWDVHHGNGTQDIFYRDGSVLFFSTHQSPWYPGTGAHSETGEGAGIDTTMNYPLGAYSGAAEILPIFHNQLLPAARTFRPDLILISAGFDSRIGDPLGLFTLTDNNFAELTRMLTDLAADVCGERLVSVLEGGYLLEGLAAACSSHVDALSA
jgi:acetoin utilization deacetylase AcuC-like enzyme